MKIITDIKDSQFVSETLPRLVKVYVMDNLNKMHRLKQDLEMRKHLKKNYNLDLNEICSNIDKYLKVIEYTDAHHLVEIDSTQTIGDSNYNIDTIIRLIDYGNSDVKGLSLVNETMKYIQSELADFYTMYMKGGL